MYVKSSVPIYVDTLGVFICNNRGLQPQDYPVFLTTLSTVLGLVPFLIDGSEDEVFGFSFAIGKSGGLLFSILALIFVRPIFMPLKQQVKKRRFYRRFFCFQIDSYYICNLIREYGGTRDERNHFFGQLVADDTVAFA